MHSIQIIPQGGNLRGLESNLPDARVTSIACMCAYIAFQDL